MVSDKYIAGFVDADGCIDITVSKYKDYYYVRPRLRISQKFRKTLDLIRDFYNKGSVITTKSGHYEYYVQGKTAVTIINRLKKHLVLKQNQAIYVTENLKQVRSTKEEVKQIRLILKEARFTKGKPRNFPSRKWLAGYIDGDGCITAHLKKDRPNPQICLSITTYFKDIYSIELIKKAFGGSINKKTKDTIRYDLYLNPTKAEKVITYFNKHLLLKRLQFDLVLDWYRNKLNKCSRETTIKFVEKLHNLKASGND